MTTQPQPTSMIDSLRLYANVIEAIASTFAKFAEVSFFRRGFGDRYFADLPSLGVVPLILLYSLFWPRHDVRGLLMLVAIYLVRCVYHRCVMFQARNRRALGLLPPLHTRYNGAPVLARKFPKLSELDIKRRVEPPAMGLLGLGMLIVSPLVGWFFIWTAVGMAIHSYLMHRFLLQQAQDLADAAIESDHLAARYRGLRG